MAEGYRFTSLDNPNRTHGLSNTRLYKIWKGMKTRCNNPNRVYWKYYGGKGIKLCNEWSEDFLSFREYALNNGYTEDMTIDRINPEKDYCPENCRFVSLSSNTSFANEYNIKNSTGAFSEAAKKKSKESLRESLGQKCKLLSGDGIKEFNSLGAAAEYLANELDRQFNSVYSQVKQIKSGKCKTIGGYSMEFET